MLAMMTIEKSFDDGKKFSKEYEVGDFYTFLSEEGEWLDKLSEILSSSGSEGDSFEVTYTVSLSK